MGSTELSFTLFPYRCPHTERMTNRVFWAGLSACLTLQLAHAQSTFGDLRGITRDPSGLPLDHAVVTVHSVEQSSDRKITSGDDGSFAVENLLPGHYVLTAAKSGFQDSAGTTV